MKIERVDYGYRSEAFSRTILEGVYESVGKLRSPYRGYRVEDVRVKGRK